MKQNNKKYFNIYIFIGLSLMILGIFFGTSYNVYKEVKCYDDFNNEIIGATCIDYDSYIIKDFNEPNKTMFNFIISFWFIYFFIGVLLIFIELIKFRDEGD